MDEALAPGTLIGSPMVVVELQQAGIFRLEGMDEEKRREALGVACPDVLFPRSAEHAMKGTILLFSPSFNPAVSIEARPNISARRRVRWFNVR